MIPGMLGKKIGMTRVFDEAGKIHPVTVVEAGPCPVLTVRTPEEHGYAAVQLGFDPVAPRKLTKPMQGVFQVLGTDAYRHLAEFRTDGEELPEAGTVFTVADLEPGTRVDLKGRSKGKGFAGVMKRYNFGGGRASHGSNFHRAPGAIGTAATPGRVWRGRKMPGQYGNVERTIRNVRVVDVVADDNLVLLAGSVPGARGTLVKIFTVQG